MYHMVIICCLIAAGYTEIVTPLHIRLPRQTSINPREYTEPTTQVLSDFPVYPSYDPSNSQNQNKETMVKSDVSTMVKQSESSTTPPQKSESTVSTTTQNHEPIAYLILYLNKLASYGARASNYLLQALGAIFLSTTVFGMVCSQTSFCSSLGISQVQVEQLARAYGYTE